MWRRAAIYPVTGIAKIREEKADARWARRDRIANLLGLADQARNLLSPAGMREARVAYLEATRLYEEIRATQPPARNLPKAAQPPPGDLPGTAP